MLVIGLEPMRAETVTRRGRTMSGMMGCANSDNPPIRTRASNLGDDFCKLKTDLDPDSKKQQARVIDQFLT